MITVHVRYHSILRHRAGAGQETLTLPEGTTLRALLEALAEKHGKQLGQVLFTPDGDIASHLVIFRNRKLTPHDQADVRLAEGDALMLFPAIAGG